RHGETHLHTRTSTISSNSSNSQAQNVIPRPTRLLIGKSDSDSGVHTQPEDTPIKTTLNRQRAPFPRTATTSKLRWIINRSHSRLEDTPNRPLSSSYQKNTLQCRVDDYRLTTSSTTTTNLDDETNLNLSSISIASSASSSIMRDNGKHKMSDLSGSRIIQGVINISSISDDNNGRNQYRCNQESVDSGTDVDEVFTNDSMKSESDEIETRKNSTFDNSTPRIVLSPKSNSDICETKPCTDTTKLTAFDLVPIVGILCLDEAC
ncbi:unnamed protein product, partial [Rodentolepis nana]|uniref:Pecanex-like protein n=1 Tax=Rodentolepis nana TaxID=102285 RepID=A0A0R3U0S7_RODNA